MPETLPTSPADRPSVSDLQVDATGRRFRLTFTPGQSLPTHRNPARLEFRVLEGSGTLELGGAPPLALDTAAKFQLAPDQPHAVQAGNDGLILEVRSVVASCSCC